MTFMKKRAANKRGASPTSHKAGIRPDKVQLAKERLAQGFYNSPVIESLVIDRLLADAQFLKTA